MLHNKMFKNAVLSASLISSPIAAYAEEITVWAWDPNFNVAIMEEAAKRYKEIDPDTTFNIISYSKNDIEQKLNTMLTSGVSEGLPEIVLIEDYNAPLYLSAYQVHLNL